MALLSWVVIAITFGVCFFSLSPLIAAADDASHSRPAPPGSSPSCNQPFRLVCKNAGFKTVNLVKGDVGHNVKLAKVKVKNWLNGVEGETLAGISASFGATFPTHAKESHRIRAVFSQPLDSCSSFSSKLSGFIALSLRGGCDFTTKAEIAQSGGAAGLVVINDKEDLLEMGCPNNGSTLNITIPVLMISKSGGETLNKSMARGVGGMTARRLLRNQFVPLWSNTNETVYCLSQTISAPVGNRHYLPSAGCDIDTSLSLDLLAAINHHQARDRVGGDGFL
ncbi:hypothetical protein RJ639_007126 [Escallonia herrerae]|uniref:PA domain-containing protein n=1 Tax=Escallonia herrerae TaxID=1293975 RepID=A0AA88W0K8_9ASTE|nr:hypothetical protein RJ639_007126 [Escallonia herrerae]